MKHLVNMLVHWKQLPKGRSKKAKGKSEAGAAPFTFAFCLLTSAF
jgi:hypothetical protein